MQIMVLTIANNGTYPSKYLCKYLTYANNVKVHEICNEICKYLTYANNGT